jgi:hypothetical protein
MGPRLRKLALTAHVATSVGWLGAAAVFLALGIVGLSSSDMAVVRAVYLAMDATGWPVLVPLALASLLTGLVQGLGTKWGLFRHYWVVVKLIMTVLAAVVVLLYTETLAYQADLARRVGDGDIGALRGAGPVLHSGVGMVLLGTAVVLSVFKPSGLTAYGRRKRRAPATA